MEQMLNNKAKAEAPSKIFTVLSAILGAIFGVFFTIMLYYCFADSEAMLPLLCFFLPIAAIGLWCVYKPVHFQGVENISVCSAAWQCFLHFSCAWQRHFTATLHMILTMFMLQPEEWRGSVLWAVAKNISLSSRTIFSSCFFLHF